MKYTAGLLILFLVTVAGSLFGQTKRESIEGIRLSAGFEAAAPAGEMDENHDRMLGGSIQVEMPVLSKGFGLTMSAGFNTYHGRMLREAQQDKVNVVPVKAGLKYRASKLFFAGADAGVSILTNNEGGKAAFTYGPNAGLLFKVSEHRDVETSVRYERTGRFTGTAIKPANVAFRITYVIGFS